LAFCIDSLFNENSPLKAFYKNTLRSWKEPKKKVQKLLEEYEASQAKYFAMKKASVKILSMILLS